MSKYQKPFHVINGRILDAVGQDVRLWGVNYYLPFNHNYVNIEEMGLDHCKAIDRDIADFRLMSADLIRMHVYEREITDNLGNIVENDQLRVLDYLMLRLEEEQIQVMMTPITWFNTVVNQHAVTDQYAFWSLGSNPVFGFTNYYTHHELCWNEDALRAQENYLDQFFARRNQFNGKTLAEMSNVVVIEVVNEPGYPDPALIRKLRAVRDSKEAADNPFKRQECQIVGLYDNWLNERKLADTENAARQFCVSCIDQYIRRTFAIVDRYFGTTVIKTHIWYGFTEPAILKCLAESPIDAISVTLYAPCYFDSAYNDALNPLTEMKRLHQYYQPLRTIGKALICYEFDAPSTLTGRALGAFGYMMASLGVQIAAYFTYTPVDVAPYNAGWVVHYMNLRHTPNKAVAFCAGGAAFRATDDNAPLPESDTDWQTENLTVQFAEDRVAYQDNRQFIHANPTAVVPRHTPASIIGIGSSCFIEHDGNGCYFLKYVDADTLNLQVLPNQKFVNDPFRGKAFRFMANRYVDPNREWIVSRLLEKGTPLTLKYPGFADFTVERSENGQIQPVTVTDGTFLAEPGEYLIRRS